MSLCCYILTLAAFYTVEFNSPLLVSSSVKFSGPCFIGIVIYFPFYFGSALALVFCVSFSFPLGSFPLTKGLLTYLFCLFLVVVSWHLKILWSVYGLIILLLFLTRAVSSLSAPDVSIEFFEWFSQITYNYITLVSKHANKMSRKIFTSLLAPPV